MSKDAKQKSYRLSWQKKLAYAAVFLFITLLLLELVAWHIYPFPISPFSERPGPTPGVRLISFNFNNKNQTFLMPKPAGTFRIMVVGESAVEGYFTRSGFPEWLGAMVEATHPGRTIEALNLGVSGVNSTYILSLYRAALRYQPDLVIFYLGNNELGKHPFFNPVDTPRLYRGIEALSFHSHLFALFKSGLTFTLGKKAWWFGAERFTGMRSREQALLTAPYRQRCARLYEHNLATMMTLARDAGVRVAFVGPAVNLHDWPPQKSVHYQPFEPEQANAFAAALREAKQLLAQNQPALARSVAEAALALDPEYAEAHFILARALEGTGELEAAFAQYQLAREWDDYPIRSPASFLTLERKLASQNGAVFLDLDRLLADERAGRSAGFDCFYDHVHFDFPGLYQTARILTRELGTQDLLPLGPDPLPDFDRLKERFKIDAKAIYVFRRQKAFQLGFAFDGREVHEEAIKSFRQMQKEYPEDPGNYLAAAVLYARCHENEAAARELDQVWALSPQAAGAAARRFFPDILELYQGQAVFSITSETNWLRVIIRSQGDEPDNPSPQLSDFGTIPLEHMTAAMIWDPEIKTFRDISSTLSDLKKEKLYFREKDVRGVDLLTNGSSLLKFQNLTADFGRDASWPKAPTPSS